MGYLKEHSYLGPVVLRILLGVAFIVAGLDKVLGLEMAGAMFEGMFGPSLGMPLLYLAIAIEVLGGLALLFGYKVRCAATILGAMILVALVKTFTLGSAPHAIGTLREVMVMNTGGGNTAVNFAYLAGLISLMFSGPGGEKRPRVVSYRAAAVSAPVRRAKRTSSKKSSKRKAKKKKKRAKRKSKRKSSRKRR